MDSKTRWLFVIVACLAGVGIAAALLGVSALFGPVLEAAPRAPATLKADAPWIVDGPDTVFETDVVALTEATDSRLEAGELTTTYVTREWRRIDVCVFSCGPGAAGRCYEDFEACAARASETCRGSGNGTARRAELTQCEEPDGRLVPCCSFACSENNASGDCRASG